MKCFFLIFVLVFPAPVFGEWVELSLKELVCDPYAEIIVVGKLSHVKERYMSVGFEHSDPYYRSYWDLGYIVGAKVLKSDGKLDRNVEVLFPSLVQDKANRLAHMLKPRKAGDEGIWIMRRDSFSGSYIISGYPTIPLPLNKEQEILDLLKSCGR